MDRAKTGKMGRIAGIVWGKVAAVAKTVKRGISNSTAASHRAGKGIRYAANAAGSAAIISIPFLYVSANAGKSFLDADA